MTEQTQVALYQGVNIEQITEQAQAQAYLDAKIATACAEADRAANIENQRKVKRAILAVMIECGFEEEAAKAFLIKAIQGQVPHLKIYY